MKTRLKPVSDANAGQRFREAVQAIMPLQSAWFQERWHRDPRRVVTTASEPCACGSSDLISELL